MRLKIILDVHPVDDALGRKVPPSEEESKERLRSDAGVVCAPDHRRKFGRVGVGWLGVLAVQNSGLRRGDVSRVNPACLERPVRCTVAACEA